MIVGGIPVIAALVLGWMLMVVNADSPVAVDETVSSEGRGFGMPTEAGLEEEFRRIRETLRTSPEFSEGDADAHYRLAEHLAHRGDVNGAKEEYRAAIRLQPNHASAYRGLGQVLLDHHEYAEAAEVLQSSVRLGRADGMLMYWLGRAHMGVGRLELAETALLHATRLNPDDPEPYADLGLVRMALGKGDAATESIERALMLRPDGADVHRLMEIVAAHRDDPAALQRAAQEMLHGMFARE